MPTKGTESLALTIPEGETSPLPKVSPLPEGHNHDPTTLARWAQRTGAKSYVPGTSRSAQSPENAPGASASAEAALSEEPPSTPKLKRGEQSGVTGASEIEPSGPQGGENAPPSPATPRKRPIKQSPSKSGRGALQLTARTRDLMATIRRKRGMGTQQARGSPSTGPPRQPALVQGAAATDSPEPAAMPGGRSASPVRTPLAETSQPAGAQSTPPIAADREANPSPKPTPRSVRTWRQRAGVTSSAAKNTPPQMSRAVPDDDDDDELSPAETRAALERGIERARAAGSPTAAVPVDVVEAALKTAAAAESESLSAGGRGGGIPAANPTAESTPSVVRSGPVPAWGVLTSEDRLKRRGPGASGSARWARAAGTPDSEAGTVGRRRGRAVGEEGDDEGDVVSSGTYVPSDAKYQSKSAELRRPSQRASWARVGRHLSVDAADAFPAAGDGDDGAGQWVSGDLNARGTFHGSDARWNEERGKSPKSEDEWEEARLTRSGPMDGGRGRPQSDMSAKDATPFSEERTSRRRAVGAYGAWTSVGESRSKRWARTSQSVMSRDMPAEGLEVPSAAAAAGVAGAAAVSNNRGLAGAAVIDIPPAGNAGDEELDDKQLEALERGIQPGGQVAAPVAVGADKEEMTARPDVPIGDKESYHSSDEDDAQRAQEQAALVLDRSAMIYTLEKEPHSALSIAFGIQHFLCMIGSIFVIPLFMVPLMGGNVRDTAKVVNSTMLMVGVSTLLHSFFGTRLPLIQGPTLTYVAPALAIAGYMRSVYGNVEDLFQRTVTEVQGAMMLMAIVKMVFAYSGGMKYFRHIVNPVVVAPAIMALGLGYYIYAFELIGRCVELGLVQLALIIILSLHLRKFMFFGVRLFAVYSVFAAVVLTWLLGVLLTASGAYRYRGCSINDTKPECARAVFTMQNCRTDANSAWSDSHWFRVPYPFQWGWPTYSVQSLIITFASGVIATVDSTSSYHNSSILVSRRRPTIGVVGRGIGMEGLSTFLAAVIGTGNGAATLSDNVSSLETTRIGNRFVIQVGAAIFILLSPFGKIGGLLSSAPPVMCGGVLLMLLATVAMRGLFNTRFAEMHGARNFMIIALSLLLAFTVPAYFDGYTLRAGHGPFRGASREVNFALNSVFSTEMYVAFMSALILDWTVPGTKNERGLFTWADDFPQTDSRGATTPAIAPDYVLPWGLDESFAWFNWLD